MPLERSALVILVAPILALAACVGHEPAVVAVGLDCGTREPDPTRAVAAQLPVAGTQTVRYALPPTSDLRPLLTARGLTPRPQGRRGTCSIFTTCEAIEFARAELNGNTERLSPEFVNWAAGKAAGAPSDGNFFHNALAGFEKHGVCTEQQMPYRKTFDAKHEPPPDALKAARQMRDTSRGQLVVRWIVPWQAGKSGVDDAQFAEIKRVLAQGYPVAAGSAHSRLLVGYTDDERIAGGGEFITEDSALNRFDKVTYEFVRKQVNDAFWIEAVPQQQKTQP